MLLNTAGIFDRCVHDLELNGGYALLPLSELQASTSSNIIISTAFEQARCALDEIASSGTTDDKLPVINPSTDSGSWTGFHKADKINGRYNAHRKGFVFSNGEFFGLESKPEFENNMQQLFHFCHDIVAAGVLKAIERRLELSDDYFDKELGPTANSSQWHLKQYHVNESIDATEMSPESVLLPTHTDPSLISVVIIDRPGVNKGGKGLEVYEKDKWTEVSHHGHDIAVIFVGSVLSYLTKQQVFSAIKHRVVNDSDGHVNERMACTLFVRPCPDAQMEMLPSKYIHQHESSKQPPSFETWNRRVAKNYMKQQKKKQ